MTFGSDRVGHEKRCYICDTPTQSHPVPNGWMCHTCKREREQTALKDALDIQPRSDLTLETTLPCWWCGQNHLLTDKIPSRESVFIGTGFHFLEEYTGFLIASCPNCLKSSDYLTTAESAERIAEQVGVSIHTYHPRHGWVDQ